MSFLYFCCIEALLTYLLRTNKTAIIIASLLINCLLSVFTCKSQYKNVGLGQYKNVGFPTFLYCLFSLHLL